MATTIATVENVDFSNFDSTTESINATFDSVDLLQIAMDEQSKVMETAKIGHYFAWSYLALGIAALAINLAILAVLIVSMRRLIYKNAFYVLIFNFALIDLVKGACLFVLASRLLRLDSSLGHISAIRFNQYTNLIFRFCNLTTVLNVLMITLNEFIYIKYPFQYEHYVKHWMVVVLIFLNWALCAMVTIGSIFVRRTSHIPLVPINYHHFNVALKSDSFNLSAHSNASLDSFFANKNSDVHIYSDKLDINSIFTLTIIAFCLACLLVITWCYITFIHIINAIRKQDKRLYNIAGTTCSEAVPILVATALSSSEGTDPVVRIVRHSIAPANNSTRDCGVSMQLLKRNKYALVIGSVILVYAMYLISYSIMQLSQYLHLFGDLLNPTTLHNRLLTRWSLHVLVGLHSVFQPLCYFRMREFRQYAYNALCFPFYRMGYDADRSVASFSMAEYPHRSLSSGSKRPSVPGSHLLLTSHERSTHMNSLPLVDGINVPRAGKESIYMTFIGSLCGGGRRSNAPTKEQQSLIPTLQSSMLCGRDRRGGGIELPQLNRVEMRRCTIQEHMAETDS